ncbi:MAG TPA: hypothetical protein DDW20_03735, partial [Firmicutes bacterium]|nr:hypothetical protein [Bacillota bacterium]
MTKLRKGLSALLLSAFMTLGVGIGIGTKSVVEGRATNNVALTFPDENKASNKQTSYSNSWNAKIGSNTWEIKNFNNNTWNNSWTYIKCGSKKTASVGSITNTTAIEKIDTIVVTVDNVTVDNVNNFYITCGKTSTSINENKIDLTIAKGENVFSLSNNEYSYFSIFVDCKKSSNGTVQISKVEYKCTLPVEPTKIESVEFSDPSKVFYCGDTINKSDFVVKDDVGDVVENFDIDVTEVPSNPGSFNITFTSEGLESKTVSFTANTTAKSVTITPEVLNITQGYVGHTEQLTALVAYNNNESTDNNVTWLSSDATASIDNTGLLILNSESGTATITATAKIKGTNNSIISNSITVTWSNLKDQSFKKMTSDTVLKTGYKVIITNSNASAVMGYYEDGKNNIGEITNGFTLKNDSITVKSDTKCIYTLVGDSTTGFSFKDENNLY